MIKMLSVISKTIAQNTTGNKCTLLQTIELLHCANKVKYSILAIIAKSVMKSSAQAFIHNAFLFMGTSNNA